MKNLQQKRTALINEVARLKKRHKRTWHLRKILQKLTVEQLKQETRRAPR
jgi:hypothetical protein